MSFLFLSSLPSQNFPRWTVAAEATHDQMITTATATDRRTDGFLPPRRRSRSAGIAIIAAAVPSIVVHALVVQVTALGILGSDSVAGFLLT